MKLLHLDLPKILATILSYLFHPLLITTLIFSMLIYAFPTISYRINGSYQWKFLLGINVMSFIIPGISTIILRKQGIISSLQMEDREERKWPFVFMVLIYSIVTFLFYRIFQQDGFFTLIFASVTVNIAILGLISLWWKISIHSAGVGGLLAFYIVCSMINGYQFDMNLMIAIILISGVVISARLQLNSHNLLQTIAGYCVGLSTGLSTLIFLI